ncbi:MAG: hypothetical protein LBP56_05635 [Odoribacteraceae bacterium]|jgi:hypothetical protein|nr:hypothetical protein [Odoribacteraceae bacterium]
MIAEDKHIYSNKPDFDIPTNKLLQWIEKSFIATTPVFLYTLLPNLNETQYAQEFVAELERTLRIMEVPLCVGREYSDIYTEGADRQRAVDFYFYPAEQGASRKSLFSVEAKRLPTPGGQDRAKEYVLGEGGGIERFKREDHGKGLPNCGMLAFIEKQDFAHWYSTVNSWITDTSISELWSTEECLTGLTVHETWAKSISIVKRISNNLNLIHFWIDIQKNKG